MEILLKTIRTFADKDTEKELKSEKKLLRKLLKYYQFSILLLNLVS